MDLTPFAYTLANTSLASQRAQFELRFNLLQNQLIRRHNEAVEKLTTTPSSTQFKIDDLEKRAQRLTDALPVVEEYRQGNLNNKGALQAIFDEITTLFATFNGDANVDASEVTAFEKQRDIVANKIENLYVFVHPDIYDGKVIQRLKEDVDSLRGQTLSVGTLTSNSSVTDFLTTLQSEVNTGIDVTQNTVSTALDLEQKINADFSTVDSQLIDLTVTEKKRRETEIANAEADLGNLLRALSLSFEASGGLADSIAGNLKPPKAPPGSAVNIIS